MFEVLGQDRSAIHGGHPETDRLGRRPLAVGRRGNPHGQVADALGDLSHGIAICVYDRGRHVDFQVIILGPRAAGNGKPTAQSKKEGRGDPRSGCSIHSLICLHAFGAEASQPLGTSGWPGERPSAWGLSSQASRISLSGALL